MKIILASGSPRRRELLEQAGIPHRVVVPGVDESCTGAPHAQVVELALRKARATAGMCESDAIIIAADTLVAIDDEVLGKPTCEADACAMLGKLSGRTHSVFTGVAILRGADEHIFYEETAVTFRTLSPEEIRAYVTTGEPMDKAGAYGVQGRGAVLVSRINGCFYTVMGLPVSRVVEVLSAL
jgi:septum formation protein